MGEKGKAHRMKVGGRADRDCEIRSATLELDPGDSVGGGVHWRAPVNRIKNLNLNN